MKSFGFLLTSIRARIKNPPRRMLCCVAALPANLTSPLFACCLQDFSWVLFHPNGGMDAKAGSACNSCALSIFSLQAPARKITAEVFFGEIAAEGPFAPAPVVTMMVMLLSRKKKGVE